MFKSEQQEKLCETWGRLAKIHEQKETEKDWLDRSANPMDLIKELEYLRRMSIDSVCQNDEKWVHRLVTSPLWKNLIMQDKVLLLQVTAIQEHVDLFNKIMVSFQATNPRVRTIKVSAEIDNVSLEDKMKDYLNKPYVLVEPLGNRSPYVELFKTIGTSQRRRSQDFSVDNTFNWHANSPKISKVGCPCNNDINNFGGYQHCAMCGSNGGYYSDHDS